MDRYLLLSGVQSKAMYAFTVLLLLTFLVSRSYSMAAPTVMTTYGPVSGTVTKISTKKTVKSYLGIPFAQAKRFEYPVQPDTWTETLHANATRDVCPQLVMQGTEYLPRGGGQGGHNLPPPVPRSPASRTFLSLCLPTPALYCVSPVIV